MSVKINRGGLDKLLKNMKELEGSHQVTLGELMGPDFISAHSRFANLEELFAASGFKVETKEDFAAIPDEEWEVFIRENTDFESWADMQRKAAGEHAKAQLMKGV
ncbi:hypothetical protein [Pseudomonas taiwanensis]|uniref:hypothetical protein n=1 Tax=Pseudomonas taiwanensis TaxID=470150 RepID=UPI0016483F88|nr:hypothetical protein [Pseudomonas taiwanensis]MBC3492376.1 hypothetical protein [Pseudomonas taiwanensis]